MLKTRVIPCLLLRDESLVKTVKFDKAAYIGDPINTVRIFNELEVDELLFLDITATNEKRTPNFKILAEIANECFMPLGYGGGLQSFEDAKRIFQIGFEKVAVNSYSFKHPEFITQLAEHFGNQAVVASIDVKKNLFGKYEVYSHSGKMNTHKNPVQWAQELEKLGAGELLLTSIDREGSWMGYDVELVKKITSAVQIPVIANGGAGNLSHVRAVVKEGNASAVALGSMVVFQKKGLGVLVNFPEAKELTASLT